MSRSKIIGGVALLIFNIGLIVWIYSVPYSSSEEISLPKKFPDSISHVIVFCGFVQCPTICPTSLRAISETYDSLEGSEFMKSTRIVFVNLEPEVEKGQTAKQFAKGFHQEFIGWQLGGIEQKQLLKDLHTYYLPSDKRRNQLAKHSPNIYLLNRTSQNYWHIAQIYTNYPAEITSLKEAILQTFDKDIN